MPAFTRRILGTTTAALMAAAVLSVPADAQQQGTQAQPTPSTQTQDPASQPSTQSTTPSTQPQTGTPSPSSTPSARVQARGAEMQDDGGGNWGWLGLLGLVGLLGFRRRGETYSRGEA